MNVKVLDPPGHPPTPDPLVNQGPTAISGTCSVLFYKVLTARGGTRPYTWSLAPGSGPLPGDLQIVTNGDTAAGQFGEIKALIPFGTSSRGPMESGTFPITIRVTDNVGAIADKACTITIQSYSFVPQNVKVGPGWGGSFSFMFDEETTLGAFTVFQFMESGMYASGTFRIGGGGVGAFGANNVWCTAVGMLATSNSLALNNVAMGANNHLSQFRCSFGGSKLNVFGPALFCGEAWDSKTSSGLPIDVYAWRYAALINASTGRVDLFYNDHSGKNSIANATGLTIATNDVWALRSVKTSSTQMTLTVEQNGTAVITVTGRTLLTRGSPGVLVRDIDKDSPTELDLFASKLY